MFELQVHNENIELYYENTNNHPVYYGVWTEKYRLHVTNVRKNGIEDRVLDASRNYSIGNLK